MNTENKPRQRETVSVRIISPTNSDRMFAHRLKLPVIIEPKLQAFDNPVFVVNDIPNR